MIWRILVFMLLVSPVHASNWYSNNSSNEQKLWKYAEQLSNYDRWHQVGVGQIYSRLSRIFYQRVDLTVEYALKLSTSKMGESRLYLIDALKEMPYQELPDICEWALKFFTTETDGKVRCDVLKMITSINWKKRDVVCEYALQYFKNEIVKPYSFSECLFDILRAHKTKNLKTVCDYLKVFIDKDVFLFHSKIRDFFEKKDMKRLKAVCDWTLKLSGSGVSKDGLIYLLSGVIDIPEKRLDEVCSQTFKFTTNGMDNYEKLNVLRVFKDTETGEWDKICEDASKITSIQDHEKYVKTLKFLKELSPVTREKIFKNDMSVDEATYNLIRTFMEIWRGEDFLKILLENSADNMDLFQRRGTQFLKFMKFKMDHYDEINDVLKVILDLEPDRLELVCDYTLDLSDNYNYPSSKEILEIFNTLKEIPPSILKEIRDFESQFIWKEERMSASERLSFIDLLGSSPSSDWNKARELSSQILGEKSSVEDRNKLTLCLLYIPSQRWETLLTYAPTVFNNQMDVRFKALIVVLLGHASSYRLPKICEWFPKFLTLDMAPYELEGIFEVLMSSDRLDTVCLRALPLMDKMTPRAKAETLRNINDIFDERWEELEKLVPFFINKDSGIAEKTAEILKLSHIDPEVVKVICSYGAQFKFQEMNEEEKTKFIKDLKRIRKITSSVSLDEAVKNAFSFIKPQMSLKDMLKIIEAFKRSHNLEDVVEYLPKLMTPKMDAFCLTKLIESIRCYDCMNEDIISDMSKLKIAEMTFEIPILLDFGRYFVYRKKSQKLIQYFPYITKILSGKEINPEFYEEKIRSMWDLYPFYRELRTLSKKLSKFNPRKLDSAYENTFKLIEAAQISEFSWEKILKLMDTFAEMNPKVRTKIGEYASKFVTSGMDLEEITSIVQKFMKFNPDRIETSYENTIKFIENLELNKKKLEKDDLFDIMELFEFTNPKHMEKISQNIQKFTVSKMEMRKIFLIAKMIVAIDPERMDVICKYTINHMPMPMYAENITKILKHFNCCLTPNVIGVLNYVPSLITEKMMWGEVKEILSNLEKYDIKYQHSGSEKTDDPLGLMAVLLLQSNSKFAEFYYEKMAKVVDISSLADTNPLFQAFQIFKSNHYKTYKELYKKRRTWKRSLDEQLPTSVEKFGNKYGILRPEFFQNKLRTKNFTVSDLPENYEFLQSYFLCKMKKFETYISVGNQDFIQKTKELTGFSHPGQFLRVQEKLIRYLTIFERQKTEKDHLSDSQIRLFQLLDIFQQNEGVILENPHEKMRLKTVVSLSKGEEGLLKCLGEIYKCPESVALGIAETYHSHALSFSLLKDEDPQNMVKKIIEQIVENFMYSRGLENFYPSLCGHEDFQCENQQVVYAMNLVGGAIGLDPCLNLEGNLDFVYPKLLKLTPLDILKILYGKQLKPSYFVQKFKKYFDDMDNLLKVKVEEFYCLNKKIIEKDEFWDQGGISQKAMTRILKDEEVMDLREGRKKGINFQI